MIWIFEYCVLIVLGVNTLYIYIIVNYNRDRHGHDHMIVGFITIYTIDPHHLTKSVRLNPAHSEVYLIQHYVIKFVSELWQAGDFPWLLWCPPPIKLTAII